MYWWILFGSVGLAFGSFGNVLLHRIHKKETLLGRSMCVLCKRTLAWFELFPLISFALLRGRCRRCRKPISARYPLVEAASAAVFLLAFWLTPGDPFGAILTALILFFLLLASVYDAEHEHIPDIFTTMIFILAALDVTLYGGLIPAIIGGIIPAVWFGLQWIISRGKAVGSGDILLGSALGFWLGTWHAVQFLVLSYIAGTALLLVLLVMQRFPRGTRIAFVPFMGLGILLTILGVGDVYVELLL